MNYPLLDRIDATAEEVKLYAFNGYAVSFAASIERSMFACFAMASDLGWEAAVDRFYERVSFSNKRRMTDQAVTKKLTGTPEAAQWETLNERIQELLGEGRSDRNLVSHNEVHVSLYERPSQAEDEEFETEVILVQEVRQSAEHVRRGRNERRVSSREMRVYCAQLTDLAMDLNGFLSDVLGCDWSHDLRRVRW